MQYALQLVPLIRAIWLAEGRDLKGSILQWIFFRFRTGLTQVRSHASDNPINAEGKKVLIIGGGDTGSDCVGTSIRQKALSVTQIEIMPKPPLTQGR